MALLLCGASEAWTGEIRGRVVCDVCGDSSVGPEDHVLLGRFLVFVYLWILSVIKTTIGCGLQLMIGSCSFWCRLFVGQANKYAVINQSSVFDGLLPKSFQPVVGLSSIDQSRPDKSPINRVLAGAEVAVLCITKSGDVFNYQAFTNSKGIYKVAETMPESDRWVSCLARPLSSFHEHCTRRGDAHTGIKFSYNLPSGHSHTVKPFLYKPAAAPMYCS
ncbi:unnamed protein product [Musa acuminata subsp. burmannicoides]